MTDRQKVVPCLWFNFNAEEAVNYYLGIFPNARILETSYYGDAVPQHKGKVLTILFELDGSQFQALNAGPDFPFTEAISLSIDCADQQEVDTYWTRLSEGGSTGQCGWLKDKFGVSWQTAPRRLMELFTDPDKAKAARAMQAMMTMTKIDIAQVERAANQ
jgi:predicted 3-demethylubiquinone-9 3-methyltransferase (glyoxalase superfamily)